MKFSDSGDTAAIVGLLRRGQIRLRSVPSNQRPAVFSVPDFDPLQDTLNILEGREFYGPSTNHTPPYKGGATTKEDLKSYIETQVYGLLLWSNCVAYDLGVPSELTLTRGRFLPYLYEHSSDLEDAFTGALTGRALELLSSAELLAKEDLARIAEQLDRIPVPNDDAEHKKAQASGNHLRTAEIDSSFRVSSRMFLGNLHPYS